MPHASSPGPEDLSAQACSLPEKSFGASRQPARDADAVRQQTAIGRVMYARLHHRAVYPQFPPTRHLLLGAAGES